MDEIKSQDPEIQVGPKEIKVEGLHWRLPGRSDPGYLMRARRSLKLREEFLEMTEDQEGIDPDGLAPEALDALVKFLSVYVVKPEDPDEAVKALDLYASEEDVEQMLRWSMPQLFEESQDEEDPVEDPLSIEATLAPES